MKNSNKFFTTASTLFVIVSMITIFSVQAYAANTNVYALGLIPDSPLIVSSNMHKAKA
jgi:hypothetical protein